MTDTVCRDQDCPQRHCYVCNDRHIDLTDQTCIWCLGLARRWLRAIPDHAAHIRADNTGYPAASPGISERTSRNADTPLMGGDKTSLTGPGGDGRNVHRWVEVIDPDTGKKKKELVTLDHAADNQAGDPPSALALLEQWERDWRETLHLNAAMTKATLTNTTTFLLDQLGWAAQHHPAFPDFHMEARQLHATLEHAAGATERPVVDAAMCQACTGIRLRRAWLRDGLSDDWHCPRCKRNYTPAEYWLAVRMQAEVVKATEDATF
jgi:hypothetical protein